MKRLLTAALAALLLLVAPPAHATWTIGPNLDLGTRSIDNGDDVTRVELPASVGGLRLGFPFGTQHAAILFDTGLSATSGGGARTNQSSLVGSLQWAFSPRSELTPYANGGLGVRYVAFHTDQSFSAATFTYGVGFGLRQKWGDSASVRGEIRYDQITQGEDGGVIVTPGGHELGFRLGFDLWVK